MVSISYFHCNKLYRLLLLIYLCILRFCSCDISHTKSTELQINTYLTKGAEGERFILQSYIFFFLCCFLAAAAIQWLISHVTVYVIPVSVIWFLFGMSLHFICQWTINNYNLIKNHESTAEDLFSYGVESISTVNAEVVYLLFLPILLYESCLNINWHKFKRFAISGICLAVLGVFYQTIVVGSLIHMSLESSSSGSWSNSFLFASAMVSTDPVAVVSVLNGMQAPDKLATMFEGEALINDGSSMLFFQFFQSFSKGNVQSFYVVFLKFMNLFGLGPFWGFGIGFLVYMWVKHFRKFPDMQVMIWISGSYFVYFIGERFLHTSGPIAIVCYGLFYVAFGHIGLDHLTHERLHHSVQALGLFANSGVFVISGVIAARMIYEALNLTYSGVNYSVMMNVGIIYLYLMFARATMVILLLPVLKRTGYGVNWKETVLLIWGGLRGAIVLTIGLMIEQDYQLLSTARYTAVLYMAGSTLLILLINGTTFELLYKILNPYPPKPFRCVYLERVMKLIDFQYDKEKKVLENHWLFKKTGILEYADRVVPILGWRRMNNHGKINLKLPSIHAAFFNISKIDDWKPPSPRASFETSNNISDSNIKDNSRYSNFVLNPLLNVSKRDLSSKNIVKAEQRAHTATANVCGLRVLNEAEGTFDPELYLQLVDNPTAASSFKLYQFDPTKNKTHTEPTAAFEKDDRNNVTRICFDNAVQPTSSNNSHFLKMFDSPNKIPSTDSNSILARQHSCYSNQNENSKIMFNKTKCIRSITSEPFGSSKFDNIRITRLRLPEWIGREESDSFTLQYPQYMFTPNEYAQNEKRVQEKITIDSNYEMIKHKISKRRLFCMKCCFGLMRRKYNGAYAKRVVSTSPMFIKRSPQKFPGRIMSAPTGMLDTRELGFDEASDYSEDYLPVYDKIKKHKSAIPPVTFVKGLRKDREGELYIMAFNAIRQMYHRLYEQKFIGGAALLTLNNVLDVSTDFAIGKLKRNPIKAWKDVLKNTSMTENNLLENFYDKEVTESMTGFQFEWKMLACRLHCFKQNKRSWITKNIHNKKWFKLFVGYPAAVVDLQLVSAYVDVHEELVYKGGSSLGDFLGPRLLQSFQGQIQAAKKFVSFMEKFYSISYSYALAVHAAAILLNWKQMLVEEQAQKGLILQEDCDYLLGLFKEQHQNLASFTPFKLSWPSFNRLCRQKKKNITV